jgi:hypothetical protein
VKADADAKELYYGPCAATWEAIADASCLQFKLARDTRDAERICRSQKVVKVVTGIAAVEREGGARDRLNVGRDMGAASTLFKKSAPLPSMGYARNKGREKAVRYTPEQKGFPELQGKQKDPRAGA